MNPHQIRETLPHLIWYENDLIQMLRANMQSAIVLTQLLPPGDGVVNVWFDALVATFLRVNRPIGTTLRILDDQITQLLEDYDELPEDERTLLHHEITRHPQHLSEFIDNLRNREFNQQNN